MILNSRTITMTQYNWHSRIVWAIREMAEQREYNCMSPSKIYFRTKDDCSVFYKPDCIWIRGRGESIKVILWEVESVPLKTLCGDMLLASLTRTNDAEFYPMWNFELGDTFREPRKFLDPYDKRRKSQIMYPEERRVFRGDQITRFTLFIIVKNDWHVYSKRYVDILKRKQWGKYTQFDVFEIIPCDSGSVSSAKRSIGKSISKYL